MAPPAYDAPPGMRKKQDYTARAANLRLQSKEQRDQWERCWGCAGIISNTMPFVDASSTRVEAAQSTRGIQF